MVFLPTWVVCTLYISGSCVEYKASEGKTCPSYYNRSLCKSYDPTKVNNCGKFSQFKLCPGSRNYTVTDPTGLVKYTSKIELWDTTFDVLNSQVALATGTKPLALRYNGQSINAVASKCSGCTLSQIEAMMGGWPATDIPITLGLGGSQSSDPIITGFDGSVFHFDEIGDYNMLWEASGLKVDTTFDGTTESALGASPAEKSFARAVRVGTPNGDMASCSLASIHANASTLQVTIALADQPELPRLLSPKEGPVKLAQMTARAEVNEGLEASSEATGCAFTTDKFEVAVYRVVGSVQAALHPDTEAWAAPYTWLNTDIRIILPFEAPVTGILGATYPLSMTAQQLALRPEGDALAAGATIDGKPSMGRGRRLAQFTMASPAEEPFLLSASLKR